MNTTWKVRDTQTGETAARGYDRLSQACAVAERKNQGYGAVRFAAVLEPVGAQYGRFVAVPAEETK